jgi:DNA-binding transcriptional regulator YiaG
MERCPFCRLGVFFSLPTPGYTVELGGRRFEFTLNGVFCNHCLKGGISKSEQARADFEVAAAFARAGVVDPEIFRFQRRALGFSSGELAELLGVTLNTLSRWENKERPLDRNAAALVVCMMLEQAEHPPKYQTIETLKRVQAPTEVTMRGEPYLLSFNPNDVGQFIVASGESLPMEGKAPYILHLEKIILEGELEHFLITDISVRGQPLASGHFRATLFGQTQNTLPLLEGYALAPGTSIRVTVKNTSHEPRKISGQCFSYAQRTNTGSTR